MYRAWLEDVLGFKLRGDRLMIDPSIRSDWAEYSIHYRYGNSWYDITVQNPDGVQHGVAWIEVDGKRLSCGVEQGITLHDDGARHAVLVRLGENSFTKDVKDVEDKQD